MKHLQYMLAIIFIFLGGCKEDSTYSIEINNRQKTEIKSVKLFWGQNHKRLDYGNFYPNTGKEVGLVLFPNGSTILSYHIDDKEIKKELDITSKFPKVQSGRIIIYIRENDVIDIEFKNEK